jgi:hypothetical protein
MEPELSFRTRFSAQKSAFLDRKQILVAVLLGMTKLCIGRNCERRAAPTFVTEIRREKVSNEFAWSVRGKEGA